MRRCLLLMCMMLSLAGASYADLDSAVVARIEALITREMALRTIPGLSIAVVEDGRLVWSNGYGLADVENMVPATSTTVYRLASISKPITAVAALRLFEDGKLDLDRPIHTYRPGLPAAVRDVTMRQLLSHTAGVRHYRGQEVQSTRNYRNVDDALWVFWEDPLLFTPGERYSYTTYGFNLAGSVIQAVAQESFEEYCARVIFRPAGMETIQRDDPHAIIPRRAQGYLADSTGRLRNSGLADVTNKVPGGGFCSTAEDLARFAVALFDGILLSEATRRDMWTRTRLNDGSSTTYGLGWGISEGPPFLVSHSGGQQRVSTFLLLEPEGKRAVAIMTNREGISIGPLARAIRAVLAGEGALN